MAGWVFNLAVALIFLITLLIFDKRNGSWLINVTISDTYDFTEFLEGLGFSDIADNLGWAMQTNGMMKSHNWTVSYSYYYRR